MPNQLSYEENLGKGLRIFFQTFWLENAGFVVG
jgi:hypothetical protein